MDQANVGKARIEHVGRGISRRQALAGSAAALAALVTEVPLQAQTVQAAQAQGTSQVVSVLNEVAYPEPISSEDYALLFEVYEQNPLDQDFLMGLDSFANNLACHGIGLAGAESDKANACLSPVSLYFALALLAQGAGEGSNTEWQLLGVLGAESSRQLAEQCANLYRCLWGRTTPDDDPYSTSVMQVANSVWMHNDVEFERGFIDVATDSFYAECFGVAEPSREAAQAMGAWIAEHTGSALEPEIALADNWILSLINTVWFKDGWTDAFNENDTFEDAFHTDRGDVTCEFMTRTENANIVRGSDYLLATLGLSTGAHLAFLLPDEGMDVRSYFGRATGIAKLFAGEGAEYKNVTYVVPKVSFDSTTQVKEVCEAMGARDIFTAEADLTALTIAPAAVSSVEHGTHFAMNEMGVEASAYTVVSVEAMMLEPDTLEEVEFRLDRPFAFRLTSPEGVVLFDGIVGDPTEA